MPYLEELFTLRDKVALVTGATRGLGHAMAEALLRAGAPVVLTGSNEALLDKPGKPAVPPHRLA